MNAEVKDWAASQDLNTNTKQEYDDVFEECPEILCQKRCQHLPQSQAPRRPQLPASQDVQRAPGSGGDISEEAK